MRDFVHQADVDHAERVLEQLHHFRHARRADRHHGFERLAIEQRADFGARRRDAADHFRNVLGLKLRIARIDALRREAQEEVLAHLQLRLLEHRQHQFVGGAGIGGRFQDHQHAGVKVFGDLLAGVDDVAHVRIFGLAQRRRHADVDGVQVRDRGEIGGGAKLAGFDQGYFLHRHVLDVGFAAIQGVDFALVDVDAGDGESGVREFHRQRQAHVSQAHHAHARLARLNLPPQLS